MKRYEGKAEGKRKKARKLTMSHSASKRLIVQLDVVDFKDMHKQLQQ